MQKYFSKQLFRNTRVLMYHGVSLSGGNGTIRVIDFERHIRFLLEHFRFISIDELNETPEKEKRRILLTFDDGFHNNYLYAVPILKKLNIPATFFISHRHCQKDLFLWFSYIRALSVFYKEPEFIWRGEIFDFKVKKRKESIQKIRDILLDLNPHPSEIYKVISNEFPPIETFVSPDNISEYFSGMSRKELKAISSNPLFELGIHTADHAFLTRSKVEEVHEQLLQNIDFLEEISQLKPQAIAYPSGDYNESILKVCRELEIPIGFSIIPIRREWNYQDIPRIGVYSPSLVKLMIKLSFIDQLRNLNFKIG